VLWGRCYEGEGAPAYWPWVQAIRAYVHERDLLALKEELGSGAVHVAQVVSEVRDRFPGLPEPPALNADEARFRLFDGVTTFVRNATRAQPLVLVLDDLHWADKPSLLLLQFLARELRGTRLLVIATYRDVEVRRQHPLSQTLAELAREQLAERVVLRGLAARDVARFVEITTGERPAAALVEAIYRETEGNPFFVNEVVRLLVSDGRLRSPAAGRSWSIDIPQSVREVVGRRLDRLSPECNRMLTTAAVIGREFGTDVLQQVEATAEDRLLDILEEALGARVVSEVPGALGRYIFAHALIRETLYEELTATRRVRLHRRIGEALEALYGSYPEPHLAELAYHFCEAAQTGDVQRAVAYAVRAADRAVALMAHEEAVRHYERGLHVLELLEPAAERERCELLLRLSESLWRSGEYDRAKAVALEAAGMARRHDEPTQLAQAALAYGGRLIAFAAVVRDEALVALLEEALAALPAGDSRLRAEVLARLAEEVTFTESFERRAALAGEAIAMARRLDDPVVLAGALRSAHWALWCADNLEERQAWVEEMLALARRVGDRTRELEVRIFAVWNLVERCEVDAAEREYTAIAAVIDTLRQPYLSWGRAVVAAQLTIVRGRLGELEAAAEETLRIGQEAQNVNAPFVFGIQTAFRLFELGRAGELEPLLGSFLGMYPAIAPNLRAFLALSRAASGRPDDARADFDALTAERCAAVPRNIAWLFTVAVLAETAALLGDTARARELFDLLAPFADRHVSAGPTISFGSAARYLGLLAATTGRREEAARHFETALAANARMGTLHALAHTQLDHAELLLAGGTAAERARAFELLNRALVTAQGLGMRPLVERLLAAKLRAQGLDFGTLPLSLDAVVDLVAQERPDLRPQAAPDGTVTLLFTDIEGSTPLVERLGDCRAQEVLRVHNRIVREQVAAHGGFEVKAQGDGFMIAFASASRAVACAVAIQRELAAQAAGGTAPIRIRAGLHTGEVIKEADDFFGRNVILAARIAAEAKGGEILASSLLRDLVMSRGDIVFDDGREVALKGLSGTHRVYGIRWT
jgi:class 3 adenylate cyclase/tetratricopeptide (TPR) repeat protein